MPSISIYDSNTFPLLAERYAREGLNDKQIALKLGIAESTYYKFKILHIEFKEAIKRGKAPVDIKVENALLKRALGFEYEEKTTEVRISENGEAKPAIVKTVKKTIIPDVGAIAFWLKNRRPEKWRELKAIDHSSKDGTMSPKVIEIGYTDIHEDKDAD